MYITISYRFVNTITRDIVNITIEFFFFVSILDIFIYFYHPLIIKIDINHCLHDVEQSSTVYVHQAEKFHAEATHVK